MTQKTFFKTRTPAKIRALEPTVMNTQKNLVETLLDTNPAENAVLLRFPILAGKHRRGNRTNAEASRKALKHGPYLKLSQPKSIEAAVHAKEHPHDVRRRDFDKLHTIPQRELDYVGYEFHPISGRDTVPRRIPFARILDSARLFSYAENQTEKGIEVQPYGDSMRVEHEGAVVIGSVPSKEKGKERYTMAAFPIPTHDTPDQHAICWGFKTEGARVPEHKTYTFGFEFMSAPSASRRIILDDKDGALALGIARHYLKNNENTVPWDNNVFAKPSQLAAQFDTLLQNNVLIYDPTLKNPDYRKLHLAERSVLLGKLIGHLGHDETMFWQAGRDPKIVDYSW